MKQNRHQSALDWFNNEFVHENSNQIVLIYNHLYNNMLCMPSFIILFFFCSAFFLPQSYSACRHYKLFAYLSFYKHWHWCDNADIVFDELVI